MLLKPQLKCNKSFIWKSTKDFRKSFFKASSALQKVLRYSIASSDLICTFLADWLLVSVFVSFFLSVNSLWELRLVIMTDSQQHIYKNFSYAQLPLMFPGCCTWLHLRSGCVRSGFVRQTRSLEMCALGLKALWSSGHPEANVTLRSPPLLHLWDPPRWRADAWTAWGGVPVCLEISAMKHLALRCRSQWSLLDCVQGCSLYLSSFIVSSCLP